MKKSKENKLLNIGFANVVFTDKILAIVSPDGSPIKRLINQARENSCLIDATYGRKTRSVLIATTGHIILSAVQSETIARRLDCDIDTLSMEDIDE